MTTETTHELQMQLEGLYGAPRADGVYLVAVVEFSDDASEDQWSMVGNVLMGSVSAAAQQLGFDKREIDLPDCWGTESIGTLPNGVRLAAKAHQVRAPSSHRTSRNPTQREHALWAGFPDPDEPPSGMTPEAKGSAENEMSLPAPEERKKGISEEQRVGYGVSMMDQELLVFDEPTTEEELAARMMLATDEFIELFGTGWGQSAPPTHDHDADPWGGLPGLFEPWYVAGEPPQLMLRPHSDALDMAIPHGRWTGGTHGLTYEPASQRTIWLREWDSTVVSDVVAYLLKRRRRTFRYCRYCKSQTPPELRVEADICMGCAGSVLGVVY